MKKKTKLLFKSITLGLLLGSCLYSAQPVFATPYGVGGAKADGDESTAVGPSDYTVADGAYSAAYGYNARAVGWYSVASGDGARANGYYSVALGSNNTAEPDQSSAVGFGNHVGAKGYDGSAIGRANFVYWKSSSAFGCWNVIGDDSQESTTNVEASAFGFSNKVEGSKGSAFGHANYASGAEASAFGYNNYATGDYSNAFGRWNNYDFVTEKSLLSGDYSSAIGHNNIASGQSASAFGSENTASDTGASAFGSGNEASGQRSTAVGVSNEAETAFSTAMGFENKTQGPRASAVGYRNKASGLNAAAFGNGILQGDDTEIPNEASGDYSSAFGVANLASGLNAAAFGNGIKQDDNTVISNEASGDYSSAFGVVNMASGDYAAAFGNNSKAYAAYSLAIGSSAEAGDQTDAGATETIAIGHTAKATALEAIAMGFKAQATGQKATSLGASSAASAEGATAVGDGAMAEAEGAAAFGWRASAGAVNSVALGTDAYAGAANSVALGANSLAGALPTPVDYTYMGTKISDSFAGKSPLAVVSVGTEGGERLVTNVAAGRISATSTDAINGSQLWYVADSINTRINDVIAGMPVVDAGNNTTVDVTPASSSGGSTPSGNASTSQPPAEIVQKTYTVSAWDTTVEADAGENNIIVTPTIDTTGMTRDYKLALNKDLTVDSVTATDITAANGAIDNITAKDIQTDTLTATDVTATNGTIDNITAKDVQTDTLTATDITATNGTIDNITTNVVKVGGGNVTIDNNGMSIAGGPSVTTDGVDAGGKKITNVADGVAPTDAVNMGQLGSGMNELGQQINRLGTRLNKVGAGAAALANMHPLDYDPHNKLSFSTGIGNYRNETAAALGVFYRPTERVMFNLGGTVGNDNNMIGLGINFALDRKIKNGNGIEFPALGKPAQATMNAKIQKLETENAEMKAEIAELRQLVQKLANK